MFLARLLTDKGIHDFLELAALFAETDFRFAVVGGVDQANPMSLTPVEAERINALPNVEYLGSTDEPEKYFSQAKVYAFPSYREGFPKSVCEALACGCVVVGYSAIGTRECVPSEAVGLLVPVRSVSDLASRIESVLTRPSKFLYIVEIGHRHAVDNYNVERVARLHMSFVCKI